MGSEDGDDQENYPDGEEGFCAGFQNFTTLSKITSTLYNISGEEGEEFDAMMGELTPDELKAAFRWQNIEGLWAIKMIYFLCRYQILEWWSIDFAESLTTSDKATSVLRDLG